jgi:hypothetical protein
MTNDNKISASISAQDMTDIMAAFATIKAKLPFLINLSMEEKRRMPNIGTERGGMVETFTIEMDLHPDLIPTYVDMPELALDGKTGSVCKNLTEHEPIGGDESKPHGIPRQSREPACRSCCVRSGCEWNSG